ncbi:hypothetical protein J1N35_013155 [Gossypium stocksii]|uniref:Uncharacterized protein n=1 Tax=Gossypium stocksii TaxID=47602 RepID=A0A9D3VTN2_9ROSI|nr:hypothetical protein J1N35_013155 [Gossypium stocksii]
MDEVVSNLIDVVVELDLVVATHTELQSTLNESVKESIHFLAMVEELPTKEVKEFISLSFDKRGKARATKIPRNMEVKKLEAIIP